MKRKHKRPLTLLEIMIVVFLIGLIGSAIGYNMKGSLDKGRAFKTEQAILRIEDALEIAKMDGNFNIENQDDIADALIRSGLFKDPEKALKDAWGKDIKIEANDEKVTATSIGLEEYKKKHSKTNKTP